MDGMATWDNIAQPWNEITESIELFSFLTIISFAFYQMVNKDGIKNEMSFLWSILWSFFEDKTYNTHKVVLF